jgi:hypothetical protein
MTRPTVPSEILKGMSEDERKMAQLDALAETVPGLSWVTELAKKPLQASHEATKKTLAGYRAMGAQGVPPEAAPAMAASAPAAPSGRVKGVYNGQVKFVDPARVEEAKRHGWVPAP